MKHSKNTKKAPTVKKKPLKKSGSNRQLAKKPTPKKGPAPKKSIHLEKKTPLTKAEREVKKQEKETKRASAFDELLFRGRQRGFVTEDEIIHILPDIEQDLESLENLYEKFETSGVKVVDSSDMLKLETDKIGEEFTGKGKKPPKKRESSILGGPGARGRRRGRLVGLGANVFAGDRSRVTHFRTRGGAPCQANRGGRRVSQTAFDGGEFALGRLDCQEVCRSFA
jgi:hypothetical protein